MSSYKTLMKDLALSVMLSAKEVDCTDSDYFIEFPNIDIFSSAF